MDGRLNASQRAAALAELPHTRYDLVVVGGGVLGAGIALDATTRGLRVALIEAGDWAGGSSGRTGKIMAGRPRTRTEDLLAIPVLRRERTRLLDRLAPHLVRRVPMLRPVYTPWERAMVSADLVAQDAPVPRIGRAGLLPAHRQLPRRAVRRIAPAIRPDLITGGVQYYEAECDDARFVLTLARTAELYGATLVHHCQATELIKVDGTVTGVRVRDRLGEGEFVIDAGVVVVAAGTATPALAAESMTLPRIESERRAYLVLPRGRIRASTGIAIRDRLIVPWGRHWIVGPSFAPTEGDPDRPVDDRDLRLILDGINPTLKRPIGPDDVESGYAGGHPMIIDAAGRGLDRWLGTAPGLVASVAAEAAGYRDHAARTVDAACRLIGGLIPPSITGLVPLLGADGYLARWNQRHLLARRARLHVARVEHLLRRHGSALDPVLDLIMSEPDLARPIPGAEDYLAAEIVHAVTHEGAVTVDDILNRRTGIAYETVDGGRTATTAIADLMARWAGGTNAR
jgi:glycerol-3-phosphate dehydrogenase